MAFRMLLTGLCTLLAGTTWAGYAGSLQIEIPVGVHGPERVDLERLVRRHSDVRLDRHNVDLLVLYAKQTRRGDNGHTRLTVDHRRSAPVRIGRSLEGHPIRPPARHGNDWTLKVAPGVYLDSIVLDLAPRPYRRYRDSYDDHYYGYRSYPHRPYRPYRHHRYPSYGGSRYRNHGHWAGYDRSRHYFDGHRSKGQRFRRHLRPLPHAQKADSGSGDRRRGKPRDDNRSEQRNDDHKRQRADSNKHLGKRVVRSDSPGAYARR